MTAAPERYYYWEHPPEPHRLRQLGPSEGYPSVEALMKEFQQSIDRNREEGVPCWILKATLHKTLVM